MTLKIPIILALTFNIASIVARPQFPPLRPPGPPREPAPIHEPQTEDGLNVHRALFTSYTDANRQSFGTSSISHSIPVYSTSAIGTPTLFAPQRTVASPVSYSSHGNLYSSPSVEQNQGKTSVIYSEAPLVSHVSFTGLGSSYSW